MAERTEYAVLRFVDKNGYCHMISDYVKGSPLAGYVREHPKADKYTFFGWLEQLTDLMLQYCKWREGECYGYVNPYAVILGEDLSFALLDTKDEENEEMVGAMQKKNVRALFMKPDRVLSLKMNFEDDMYGLGKTIQFLAAKCDVIPKISRREERILKKTVIRCLDDKKKSIKDLKEVHRELRQLKEGGERKEQWSGWRKRFFTVSAAVILIVAAVTVFRGNAEHTGTARTARAETGEIHEKNINAVQPEEEKEGSAVQRDDTRAEPDVVTAKLEIALLYITELEEREKGRACLEEIKEESKLAQTYLKIISFLQKENNETYIGRELEQALQEGREELKKIQEAGKWEEKQDLYEMPFLRAYGLLDTDAAVENTIQICTELLENEKWKQKEHGIQRETEIRTSLAGAYEKAKEFRRAAEEYVNVKELSEDGKGLEQVYIKLEDVYEKAGQGEKVWETVKEAADRIPDSEQIWCHYLRRCCADSGIERAACADYVKQALAAAPGLAENEEFQKLQKEYEITIEGENICVGK